MRKINSSFKSSHYSQIKAYEIHDYNQGVTIKLLDKYKPGKKRLTIDSCNHGIELEEVYK